jgi:hypothetical protein
MLETTCPEFGRGGGKYPLSDPMERRVP